MTTTTLTGFDAITYADVNGVTLCKYADPVDGAREGLSVSEARAIAAEDPSIVYLETDADDDGPDFAPTHTITVDGSDTFAVMVVDGAAYTREEWESDANADWERQDDGGWTCLGKAAPANVSVVDVKSIATHAAFVALFPTTADAIDAQNTILQIGDEFLPSFAKAVFEDGDADPAPEYWAWLASQIDAD